MDYPVTNKYNLPDEICTAIMKDRYTAEDDEEFDFSASTLVAPTQQTVLKNKYRDSLIVRDVTDYFWAFLGSIAHTVLEEAWKEKANSFVERRIYTEIEGKTVSGKLDCYADNQIRDYKSTKSYKIMKGDYKEWEEQLNVYAFLCRENEIEVSSLMIYALIFDWKKHEKHKAGYPDCPIVKIPLRLWPYDEQKSFVSNKVSELIQGYSLDDESLSEAFPCSEREMWSDVRDYAVIKQGAARATKVFDNEEDAVEYLEKMKSKEDYTVEKRMSARTRCLDFCPVSHVCIQNRKLSGLSGSDCNEECIF
jgi:hypothetical protein